MILYTVIPCYNEELVLPETIKVMREKYAFLMERGLIEKKSRVLFVDDGSSDKTWDIIRKTHEEDKIFCGIKLSRNRGHQNALLAGLMEAKEHCDAAVSVDADLQDDIDAIDKMIEKYNDGCEIVYGVRNKRSTDKFMKRFTAEVYYRVMEFFGTHIIFNHADYRLMSRRTIEALADFDEVNLFLRGIVPMLGFKSDKVYYERRERFAGESKYSLAKMLDLAWNGITSFSVKPVDIILFAGVLTAGISVLAMLVMAVLALCGVLEGAAGWVIASVFLCTGINLTALGIVGQYVCRAYLETKHRPKYIVEEKID
ncbi:MAG: glycosyltransferase family 2 protein [Oscillospiraceae bacterium]|nr:glycosyltransferase family 2 protein [Oscillospiraceae bacterium]MBQ4117642.1 glycosyltransferase family 2 protein [Oscillospiraceae bacterium]